VNVVIRADASLDMGVGHIMRCLTLAEALKKKGANIRWICREHPGNINELLKQRGMQITALPQPAYSVSGDEYSRWLGETQEADAIQTIAALRNEVTDWLVVDHYGLSEKWEVQIRPQVKNLMVIDDLANRPHDCDVLLDQNFSNKSWNRYSELVHPSCRKLCGPRYALLRPEYAAYRSSLRGGERKVKNVLVYFGGSDLQNMTGLALQALCAPELSNLHANIIVGTNNPHRMALERQSIERPRTTLYGMRPHLAELMAEADFAIGAGGVTTWERMCLGLPATVISLADNQRQSCEALGEADLIYYAGGYQEVNLDRLVNIISASILDSRKNEEIRKQSLIQVDGLGALRLAEVMSPADREHLEIRTASLCDSILYFNWANDSIVRKNAVAMSPIPWETHEEWFMRKNKDADCHLYVLEAAGLPVGQIRFDVARAEARIDYSLDTIVRGRGYGILMLNLGIEAMRRSGTTRFCADVKTENLISSNVFLKAGFIEKASSLGGKFKSYQLDTTSQSILN